jgi:quinol monooxygenase YgiN
MANARASAKEEGVARFDIIQQIEDPCKFVLVEVYKNEEAPGLHKETEHYNAWRETVADMMAEPRSNIKYKNLFPATSAGWDYAGALLEE